MKVGFEKAGRIAATALVLALFIWRSPTLLAQAGPTKAPTAEVKIDNFSFGPVLLTIAPGTTVTWTNRDDIPHTVVADGKAFKSKVLDTDETLSYTFDKPGTYAYFCSIHPHMTGKVVVK